MRKEGKKILDSLIKHKSGIINQIMKTHSDQIGTYRFFGNQYIELEQIQSAIYRNCQESSSSGHILCIQDTSEINYSHLSGKLKANDRHIGPTGNEKEAGFFIHPVLALCADDYFPIGFPSVKVWNRSWSKQDKYEREYHLESIENKESYRWIESANQCKKVFDKGNMITVIGDRESDIYEEFVRVPDERTHLLVRSRGDRKLAENEGKLYQTLATSPLSSTYSISIRSHHGGKTRQAHIEVRYCKVKIALPKNHSNRNLPAFVELWAVEARENAEDIPEGEDPILWRLLTTHEITDASKAIQIIQWYELRWQIEELFRTLKSQGLNVEGSQIGDGFSLKKLCLMALVASLQVMQLVLARDGEIKREASIIFTTEEIQFLTILCKHIEGKTEKQRNPFIPNSIAWASWIIARIGGWNGYKSQAPPGHITMKRGLDSFNQQFQGWIMALKWQT